MILKYINTNNPGNYHCYNTRKISLDEDYNELFTHEAYDRDDVSIDIKGKKYAETDGANVDSVPIDSDLIKSPNNNNIKYFLDGSRHTFKVDDIAIGSKIFPIIAGQIVVGCGYRVYRDIFKRAMVKTEILISLPKIFYSNKNGKREDYARKYALDMTAYLQANNRFAKDHNIKIEKILFYDTDGSSVADKTDKNRFMNSGIAQIQNAMTDAEQLMVEDLCKQKKLSDYAYLIKDGSIQYNPSYSQWNRSKWNNMRANYKHVIGVSKSFDPTLLHDLKPNIAKVIAELKPFHRTKAFRYRSEQSNNQYFAIWYVRLRKSDFRQNHFSDVVKCELLMTDETQPFETETIDWLSANIIREAYPVCFGSDSRWANHLYPVYLTELFCKAQYINKNIFLGLF